MRRYYLGVLAAVCGIAAWGLSHNRTARAADNAAGGTLHLESGVLMANGDTLRVLDVPVASASGDAKCFDITCKFSAGADGSLRVDSLNVVPTTMLPNLADQFIPGTYADGYGSIYVLHGPAASQGGRTSWSLDRQRVGVDPEKKDLPAFDAAWTTGPAVGSPDILNKPDIKTLPPGFAFGMATGGTFNNLGWQIPTDWIVGARQIGNSLQVAYFAWQGAVWREIGVFVLTPYTQPKAQD
ncbi:MAG TPA: hypothetical protein VMD30_13350 [Tepidisphaeraceae bacterium]|nr:hypothetical protein [Tepidisphaeraceae bacterium]